VNFATSTTTAFAGATSGALKSSSTSQKSERDEDANEGEEKWLKRSGKTHGFPERLIGAELAYNGEQVSQEVK